MTRQCHAVKGLDLGACWASELDAEEEGLGPGAVLQMKSHVVQVSGNCPKDHTEVDSGEREGGPDRGQGMIHQRTRKMSEGNIRCGGA